MWCVTCGAYIPPWPQIKVSLTSLSSVLQPKVRRIGLRRVQVVPLPVTCCIPASCFSERKQTQQNHHLSWWQRHDVTWLWSDGKGLRQSQEEDREDELHTHLCQEEKPFPVAANEFELWPLIGRRPASRVPLVPPDCFLWFCGEAECRRGNGKAVQ